MKQAFIFYIFLAGLPRLLFAQTAITDPRPFFVELRSNANLYEIHYLTSFGVRDINSFPITAGYYFIPRLAVQLSGAYGHSSDNAVTGTRTTPDGVYTSAISSNSEHAAASALIRYALYKRQSRLRVDALVGLAWAYDSFTYNTQGFFTSAPNATAITLGEKHSHDKGSQFFATAGVGLRWVFNRHFELIGDLSFNRNLDNASEYIHQQATGNQFGLTSNRSLGLRYRFNLRKPAPKPAS